MKNIGNLLFGALAGATALAFNGCETPEQTRALGVLMQLGAANSRNNLTYDQRVGASIIGNALENQAQSQVMVQAAQEGRDQIVINVPQQQLQQPQIQMQQQSYVQQEPVRPQTYEEQIKQLYNQGRNIFFVCNYVRDFDRDDGIGADEIIGVKRSFNKSERITAVGVNYEDMNGKMLKEELIDGNGNTIKMQRYLLENVDPKGRVLYMVFDPQELQRGNYTVTFYEDDKYLGKTDFEVTE